MYAPERYRYPPGDRPDPARLRTELARLRRNGFAVNQERSERGLVAVRVPVRDRDGTALACLSVSLPGVRYDPHRLQPWWRRWTPPLETDLAQGH